VVEWFQSEWGFAFIALAGMTTGLFRIASLGAGFTGMNPLVFILILCASRGVRWITECAAVKIVGDRIWNWPGHYFKYATIGAVLILLATLLALTFAA
jgi:membrane protein YqaA with SNARE-associated domain